MMRSPIGPILAAQSPRFFANLFSRILLPGAAEKLKAPEMATPVHTQKSSVLRN